MVVFAVQDIDVQCKACLGRKAVEDVRNHLAAQVADLFAAQLQMRVAVRAGGQVDDRTRQGLIQRRKSRAKALDAADLAQRLSKSLAESNRTVLRRVVVIDPQVALALQLQRHAAMLGERMQHVVQETNARRHLDGGRRLLLRMRVQRDRHLDLRLVRAPLDRRCTS